MFFCNNIICINRAILQPQEIAFTTPKCQQYQLRMFSLCLLLPDPRPEQTLTSLRSFATSTFYGAHIELFQIFSLERRGEVTLKYGYIHKKYASQHLNTSTSMAQLQKQHSIIGTGRNEAPSTCSSLKCSALQQ